MGSRTHIFLCLVLGLLATAHSLCPNSCSGHGICGKYDRCTCHRDWIANDCSERACPWATAFVTTPQGDLNMDGDKYDNSGKLIVGSNSKTGNNQAQTGSMTINTNQFTFDNSNALAAGEIIAGDAVKIVGEQYVVVKVTGSNTLFLDHRAAASVSGASVYRFLETQANPAGDWESWPGDYKNGADEGHYYMECSNRGLCDRKTGQCECFEGYDGRACARTACPNNCNGHGTCESVDSLRTVKPILEDFTAMVSDVGKNVINTDKDWTVDAAAEYMEREIIINSLRYKITSVSGRQLTVSPALSHEIADWTAVSSIPKYTLWDANKNFACHCDALYSGYDCSSRKCPTGDDPLTTQGENNDYLGQSGGGFGTFLQKNEKQMIQISEHPSDDYSMLHTNDGGKSGSFKLGFTDAYGKVWYTRPIPMKRPLSSTATVTSDGTVTFDKAILKTEIPEKDHAFFDHYLQIGADQKVKLNQCSEDTHSSLHYSGCTVTGIQLPNSGTVRNNVKIWNFNMANEIKDALEALPNGVAGKVRVVMNHHQIVTRYTVEFLTRSGDLPAMACDASNLHKSKYEAVAYDKPVTVASNAPSKVVYNEYYMNHDRGVLCVKEIQIVTSSADDAMGGTFTLSLGGSTTSGLAVSSTASQMKSALELLASIGTVSVTRGAITNNGYSYSITFDSDVGDIAAFTVDASTVTGTNNVVSVSEAVKGDAVDVSSLTPTVPVLGAKILLGDEIRTVTYVGALTGGGYGLHVSEPFKNTHSRIPLVILDEGRSHHAAPGQTSSIFCTVTDTFKPSAHDQQSSFESAKIKIESSDLKKIKTEDGIIFNSDTIYVGDRVMAKVVGDKYAVRTVDSVGSIHSVTFTKAGGLTAADNSFLLMGSATPANTPAAQVKAGIAAMVDSSWTIKVSRNEVGAPPTEITYIIEAYGHAFASFFPLVGTPEADASTTSSKGHVELTVSSPFPAATPAATGNQVTTVSITFGAADGGGTFKIRPLSASSDAEVTVAFDVTAADLETAINNLAPSASDPLDNLRLATRKTTVVVTRAANSGNGYDWSITFQDQRQQTVGMDGSSLTGTSPRLTFEHTALPVNNYIWFVGKGTTEGQVCSGRGLCAGESGICECFPGYTGEACESQDALAV